MYSYVLDFALRSVSVRLFPYMAPLEGVYVGASRHFIISPGPSD